jgi:hypothetical protein
VQWLFEPTFPTVPIAGKSYITRHESKKVVGRRTLCGIVALGVKEIRATVIEELLISLFLRAAAWKPYL